MRLLILCLGLTWSVSAFSQNDSIKWESEFLLEFEVEHQYFPNEGAFPYQLNHFTSGAIKPKFSTISKSKKHQFVFEVFLRGSLNDAKRSHFDIREAYYRYNRDKWAVSVGAKKIFWGVTESAHLVDVINQADQVEAFDGSEKLGQPMVQFTLSSFIGSFEFYYLPIARRRQFPGQNGRYRFPEVLQREEIPFTTSLEEWHPSLAGRWYETFNKLDLGLSYFYGVAREPMFLGFDPSLGLDLSYPIIHQIGFDAQYTVGALILKLEAINRKTERQEFFALATGFEYTLGNVANSGVDIGIVSEYLYDSRGVLTFSGLDNDLFIGSRISLNDIRGTTFLFGSIVDLNRTTTLFRFEGSRRFKGNWKADLLISALNNVSNEEILYNFRQDDLLQMRISKFL
ncbi:hypothetical protein [Aquiflexum lacus]|uniref:hypothetical protein n=1 Tax=Aquiflexum lacus TaxID=2483805 RepID=UPI0018948932|nr:hypothetical protein [Aquiflexum lacus]